MSSESDRGSATGRENACRDGRIKDIVDIYLESIAGCGGDTVDRTVFYVPIRNGLHVTCRVFVGRDTNGVWATGLLKELAALLETDYAVTQYTALGGIVHGLDVTLSPTN